MNIETALDVAHQARRSLGDGECSNQSNCTHCAALVLATEVRQLRLTVRQLERLVESAETKRAPTICGHCGGGLIDGICAKCDV